MHGHAPPMAPSFSSIPVALTIAGSDCSSGAGIQADLKTFAAMGVHGLTALTCVVSETAAVVEAVLPLPPEFVAGQIALLARGFPLAAIKTGMLFSAAHIRVVAAALAGQTCPLVVDPVMMASTGAPLVEPDAIDLYRDLLLPMATVFTPNLDEARVLLDGRSIQRENLCDAAADLAGNFGTAVLLKGGHLRDGIATDVLVENNGTITVFDSPYIDGVSTHGTGCTYSAAITAHLARGCSLVDAVGAAKSFISRAISGSFAWTTSNGRIEALDQIQRPPHS